MYEDTATCTCDVSAALIEQLCSYIPPPPPQQQRHATATTAQSGDAYALLLALLCARADEQATASPHATSSPSSSLYASEAVAHVQWLRAVLSPRPAAAAVVVATRTGTRTYNDDTDGSDAVACAQLRWLLSQRTLFACGSHAAAHARALSTSDALWLLLLYYSDDAMCCIAYSTGLLTHLSRLQATDATRLTRTATTKDAAVDTTRVTQTRRTHAATADAAAACLLSCPCGCARHGDVVDARRYDLHTTYYRLHSRHRHHECNNNSNNTADANDDAGHADVQLPSCDACAYAVRQRLLYLPMSALQLLARFVQAICARRQRRQRRRRQQTAAATHTHDRHDNNDDDDKDDANDDDEEDARVYAAYAAFLTPRERVTAVVVCVLLAWKQLDAAADARLLHGVTDEQQQQRQQQQHAASHALDDFVMRCGVDVNDVHAMELYMLGNVDTHDDDNGADSGNGLLCMPAWWQVAIEVTRCYYDNNDTDDDTSNNSRRRGRRGNAHACSDARWRLLYAALELLTLPVRLTDACLDDTTDDDNDDTSGACDVVSDAMMTATQQRVTALYAHTQQHPLVGVALAVYAANVPLSWATTLVQRCTVVLLLLQQQQQQRRRQQQQRQRQEVRAMHVDDDSAVVWADTQRPQDDVMYSAACALRCVYREVCAWLD